MKNNKFIASLTLAIAVLSFCAVSSAAEKKTTTTAAPKAGAILPTPPKPNFGMFAGTIASIDNADPANVKLTVKNDADGAIHTISVTPWTNITKVTDISELKEGEQVRMMTRKVEDKDVAMGIMFGKLKTMPAPRPAPGLAPKTPQSPQTSADKVKK